MVVNAQQLKDMRKAYLAKANELKAKGFRLQPGEFTYEEAMGFGSVRFSTWQLGVFVNEKTKESKSVALLLSELVEEEVRAGIAAKAKRKRRTFPKLKHIVKILASRGGI